MSVRNIYFILLTVLLSTFISSKTSLKDQIIRQVAVQLEKNCLETPSSEQLFQGALSGMTTAVGDDLYTEYVPPRKKNEYMRELQGQYAGVGLCNFLKDDETGEFYFVPLRDSPAYKAGLKPGDRIVAVEDHNVNSMSIIDLTNLLRGKEKTEVRLKVRLRSTIEDYSTNLLDAESNINAEVSTDDEQSAESGTSEQTEIQEYTLTRDVVQQDIVSGDRLDKQGNWIFTLKDQPEIGYICINEFTDATGKQTCAALDKLEKEGVCKVIIDFRGNPGGFLQDAVEICNELLSSGSPIIETRNKKGPLEHYVARKYTIRRFQVAVLINGGSASASEIVSAALQDAGVAKVIGVRSYGKGTIQGLFELPCNTGVLRMTTASFWRPSGSPIHRMKDAKPEDQWGVSPDPGYEVPVSLVQNFYSSWVRSLRVLSPEASDVNEKSLAFMTRQTNNLLQRVIEGKGLKRLEAAAEMGVDISQLGTEESQPSEESDNKKEEVASNDFEDNKGNNKTEKSSDENSSQFIAFRPQGRTPYFDPQLDRAIDYLLSEKSLEAGASLPTDDSLEIEERRNIL